MWASDWTRTAEAFPQKCHLSRAVNGGDSSILLQLGLSFLPTQPAPRSSHFPYTTLFRSRSTAWAIGRNRRESARRPSRAKRGKNGVHFWVGTFCEDSKNTRVKSRYMEISDVGF